MSDAAAAAADLGYSKNELMIAASARQLAGARNCFVGVGLPNIVCNLAQRTSAPGLQLIYESGAYGNIGFAKALEVSCNTFFYRVGYNFWQRFGSDPADIDAKDPLVEEAKEFGFGSRTGIDLPGEAPGRIADRHWKQAYYESQKDYYCDLSGKPQTQDTSDFVYKFAYEFCLEGNLYRAGDAVNFSIGQGDTIVTPLQLARGYAALSNGGTLWAPTVAKAIVDSVPKVSSAER